MAAKKNTQIKDKARTVGRPSLYDPAMYPEQARKLTLLGATDAELGEFFGVDERTINRWKRDHPEFCQSIKAGKDLADADVAERLYDRAMGYSHSAVKLFQYEGRVIEGEYTEHYPPDATSMIFWLKNRQPAKWRDKVTNELTGPDGRPLTVFTGFSNAKAGPSRA